MLGKSGFYVKQSDRVMGVRQKCLLRQAEW